MGDLMIHIQEDLDPNTLMDIEDQLNRTDGVSDCHMARKDMHMMAVSYDGAKVSSETLLHKVTDRQLHAQLIGF
jgi:hypothetical protein